MAQSGLDTLPRAEPSEVGMSRERLARIAPVMQRYIDEQLIPGALTLVARHGKIVHVETHGHRDAENALPIENDTIFRIASMTKPITSVALMMLYEQLALAARLREDAGRRGSGERRRLRAGSRAPRDRRAPRASSVAWSR
jgi:CubicO group peptidase (beta-lactamase class C family)